MKQSYKEKEEEREEEKELERVFLGDDLEDKGPARTARKSRPGKAKREVSSPGVETFTFDDFDDDGEVELMKPRAFKPPSSPSPSSSTHARPTKHAKNLIPDDDLEDSDLTPSELQNIRDWETELSLGEKDPNIKIRGARPMRGNSKFAGREEGGWRRKSGKDR